MKDKIFSIGLFLSLGSGALRAESLIKVDGSSTVFPITEAVAEEFQKTQKDLKVTVGISGTGGGFKKFCRGETDVQNASRPILKSEMADCKAAGVSYYELPIAYDALTVVVNPKNTWATSLTFADLKKIWQPEAKGKVMKWKDVQPSWPDLALKLFGAGADSGTFDYFTEAVVGKAKSSRSDFTASEDDNTLVQGVAMDKGALAFLPYAYFEPNRKRLKALPLIAKAGAKAVAPSEASVKDANYPLSRPLFIYVSAKAYQRSEIKKFSAFYLEHAAELARQVKYVALPPTAYITAKQHLEKSRLGTVMGGEQNVGLKIETLMKRETAL